MTFVRSGRERREEEREGGREGGREREEGGREGPTTMNFFLFLH